MRDTHTSTHITNTFTHISNPPPHTHIYPHKHTNFPLQALRQEVGRAEVAPQPVLPHLHDLHAHGRGAHPEGEKQDGWPIGIYACLFDVDREE